VFYIPKGFTEAEKEKIREKLLQECKEQWEQFGYRKTNIDTLCSNVGISKGGFYIFFSSKEQVFLETIKKIQHDLYNMMTDIMIKEENKNGVRKALKAVYTEYNRSSFLYNTASSDFVGFLNKISDDEKKSITQDSLSDAKKLFRKPFEKLRISEEQALSVMSALLFTIKSKDKMLCNHFEVFDFMLDNLINQIFD
jgi:AcrR family transcriptional regulator